MWSQAFFLGKLKLLVVWYRLNPLPHMPILGSSSNSAANKNVMLTLSQTTNFRLFQTETVCRQHYPIRWKWYKVFLTGRKHCGKRLVWQTLKNQGLFGKGLKNMDKWGTVIWMSRKHSEKSRNCSLQAISFFLTLFSKAVCCWSVKMSIYGVKVWEAFIKFFVVYDSCKTWLTHSHTTTPFDAPGKQAFWKHCGKRRNCL